MAKPVGRGYAGASRAVRLSEKIMDRTDGYDEELTWRFWGCQSNSETDLVGDPAIDANGNGGKAWARWRMDGSAVSPVYAVGYLTYVVNQVVNNEDLDNYIIQSNGERDCLVRA